MLGMGAAISFGQDDEARFSGWSKVETAAETRTFKESMRSGGAFDAAARGFFEEIALPQLAVEANQSTIAAVRKRMRDVLLGEIANEKSAEEATKTFASFMESLASKEDADPVVRVNAMLLIGELQSQGPGRKPWQPAAATLVQAAANTDLPKALRIAACVGLAKHVEATKGVAEEQQRLAAVAGPAIMAILKEPITPQSLVENDWMVSRCLSMLSLLGPMPPDTAAEVARLLGESNRSINVRVRAAAALAAVAGPASNVDGASLIKSIRELAVTSLERDTAAADRLLLDRQYGGGSGPLPGGAGMMPPGMMPPGMMPPGMMPPGMMPGDPSGQPATEQLIPREACRRAAWRLSTLADAILSEDSKRGLALLGGDVSPDMRALAQTLRRAAMDLDTTPDEATLRQSLAELKPPAPAKAAEDAGDADGKPANAAATAGEAADTK
jgi:hypothetical protein